MFRVILSIVGILLLLPVFLVSQELPTSLRDEQDKERSSRVTTPFTPDIDSEYGSQTNELIIPNRQLLEQALGVAIDPDEYFLGPGDQLLFKTWGVIEEQVLTEITSEGFLIIPGLTEIAVDGLSLSEATGRLKTEVEKSLPNTQFSLRLMRLRKFRVYVVGEVENPGTYYLRGVDRVSDAIRLSGDFNYLGNDSRIRLLRQGQADKEVSLSEYLSTGNLQHNPQLHGGDIIIVPPLADTDKYVRVQGNISVPGIQPILGNESLWDFLQRQRSLNKKSNLRKVLVTRNDQKTEFDLLADINTAKSFKLRANDVVYVPSLLEQVYVRGEVLTPGAYPFEAGQEARVYAGLSGMSEKARDIEDIYVIRATDGSVAKGENIIVESGDIVVVPRKTRETIREFVTILTPIVSLAISLIAVTR